MPKLSSILVVACWVALGCQPDRAGNPGSDAAPEKTASASASAGEAPKPSQPRSVKARRHLPEGCDVALEVDVQRLFTNPRLGPQLLAGVVPPKDPKLREQVLANPEQAAFLRFLEASKIEPSKHLKTIAFCLREAGPTSESRFLAIIAGDFPEGLVETMREHAPPGKSYTLEAVGTHKALYREGKWMSQGSGNVVLFGDDKELMLAAQKPADGHERYALAKRGDVVVTLSERALASLQGPPQDPLVASLRQASQARLQIELGSGELKGVVSMPDVSSVEKTRGAIEATLTELKAQSLQAPPQMRQMIQPSIDVLEKAKFTGEGKLLRIAMELPPGMLEMGLQRMVMSSLGAGGLPAAPPGQLTPALVPRQAPRTARAARPRSTPPVGRSNRSSASERPRTAAPMLPQLPSFQLTPPSVLQKPGSSTLAPRALPSKQ